LFPKIDPRSRSVVSFDLPELRHNIDMLLDRCEEDLISADRRLKHNKNNVEVLQVNTRAGLPDSIFSNQKSQFG
jgi:hypothetical protein